MSAAANHAQEHAQEDAQVLRLPADIQLTLLDVAQRKQSVNRQLGLWQEQGLLRVRYGQIELLDRPELSRLAQG